MRGQNWAKFSNVLFDTHPKICMKRSISLTKLKYESTFSQPVASSFPPRKPCQEIIVVMDTRGVRQWRSEIDARWKR